MAIVAGTGGRIEGAVTSGSVTVDAGSDRMFFAVLIQDRNPPILASPVTLNGVAGTVLDEVTGISAGSANMTIILVYWLESDIPTAGSYTLAWTGSSPTNRVAYKNFTGVSQSAPSDRVEDNDAANASSDGVTVPNWVSGDLAIGGGGLDGTSNVTSAAAGSLFAATPGIRIVDGYSLSSGALTWNFNSVSHSRTIAYRFQEASSGPSLDPITGPLKWGQSGLVITGSGFGT